MNRIKKFLEKIKKYLVSIFDKKSIKLIESGVVEVQNDVNDFKFNEEEQEKERIFRIYNNVKEGIIKITDLMIDDLIKVQVMTQTEVISYDRKIDNYMNEIMQMETEIDILEQQNQRMKNQIKANMK